MNGQHTTASNNQYLSVRQHRVVCFVDPATCVHTKHAEFYWNQLKTKFKRVKDVYEAVLPYSTWMSSCGRNFMEVLLLEWPIMQIAVLYNLS